MRNNTICLCGSTRFVEEFQKANEELTKLGLSVISISMVLPRQPDGSQTEENLKELLDLVHFDKILLANAIVVVGNGYIGRSTAREIIWARMQNKGIVSNSQDYPFVAKNVRNGLVDMKIVAKAANVLELPELVF